MTTSTWGSQKEEKTKKRKREWRQVRTVLYEALRSRILEITQQKSEKKIVPVLNLESGLDD